MALLIMVKAQDVVRVAVAQLLVLAHAKEHAIVLATQGAMDITTNQSSLDIYRLSGNNAFNL